MSKLNQTLRAELEKLTETFLECEQNVANEPYVDGIKLNFLYNLKNGVDVKITVGRNIGEKSK